MSASPWYQATSDASAIPAHVAERAVEWLVELQHGAAAPEVVAAWKHWRAEHPDHERAWQRIESVRGRLQPLTSPLAAGVARAALAPAHSARRRRAVKTLALLVFAGGTTWAVREHAPWRAWVADYRTGVGEQRTLTLPDGTRLILNTASAVDIAFDATGRVVRLVAGEILVSTAHDPQHAPRPFLVETPHGTAQALGTRYAMRLHDKRTEVTVFEGAVQIRPRAGRGRSLVLDAGYHASYTAHAIAMPDTADPAGDAWADGVIVARAMRLGDFVRELGRYSTAALSCDPAIADRRVSGTFPLADIHKVLETLGTTLDVRIEAVSRFWGRQDLRLVPRQS